MIYIKKLLIIFYLFLCFIISSKEILIKVIDKDLKIPLEGAKVYIKNIDKPFFTNNEGKIKIEVKDDVERVLANINLIGYENKKMSIDVFGREVVVELAIGGILEGKELVIEEERVGSEDEELGVSTVIDNDQMKSTAEIGLIEDVLSSIKTLPGVIYAGTYGSELSVRGGYPDELTVVYDDFIVRYPYIWGGAYSIFNPNIIESALFSTGIFKAKYGYAASGLLEMKALVPDKGIHAMSKVSISSVDVLLQTRLWKNSGLLIGGRYYFWDLPIFINDSLKRSGAVAQDGISMYPAPYIRSAYMKWFWKPRDKFEWYVNALFNADGAGFDYKSEYDANNSADIKTDFTFNYYNYYTFAFTGFKILPTEDIFIHFLAGYEFLLQGIRSESHEEGEQEYSDDFIEEYWEENDFNEIYGDLPNKFKVDGFDTDNLVEHNLHSLQTKIDLDFTIHKKILLSCGTGMFYDYTYAYGNGTFYSTTWDNGQPEYKKFEYDVDKETKNIIKSFMYINFNFNIIPETLKIDVGARIDHNVLYGEGFRLNTIPAPGPRFNIVYTPLKDLPFMEKLSISAGIGLFSKVPLGESMITSDMDLKDFDIHVPKVLSTVLGLEIQFPFKFKFKIEGYYKYYFQRLYINDDHSGSESEYYIHNDGYGHVAGFDLMIQRQLSRYIDGWISYSFVYARYYNPEDDNLDDDDVEEPRARWYYPSFHRFHTLNFVLNVKPTSWMTITTKLSFATGKPIPSYGDEEAYGTRLSDGTIVEMWTREQEYSDELRSQFSIPLDLKIAFHFYIPKTRIYFEIYVGVRDLFVFIYNPKGGVSTNRYTGEESPQAESGINFTIPEPSFGVEINF